MLFIDDIHNSLGWSSQYDTCSDNIVLRRTRIRRYYGFLFFGECAMVCHLPRQVGDFAACCLHILFSLNLFSADVAVVYRDYDVRLAFLCYMYRNRKEGCRVCTCNRI